jgi:hypothetical protein
VVRTLAWPASPKSRIMLDVRVKAVSASEWTTDIYVTGAYDGPNDIAANKDYRIEWQADGSRLLEKGSVTLVRSSGETIDQTWSSIITPEGRPDRVAAMFKKFPKAGQRVTASIAPFQLKQNGMSYSWDGVVTRAGAEKPNKPGS